MYKRLTLGFTLIVSVLLFIVPVTQAQGGLLSYGMTVSEKLDANVPQALYTFSGNVDDVVTIYALGWALDFQPTLTLLGPTGQLAFSNRDNLTPMSNDARITVRLPQAGAYSILVGSATPNFNTYTLALQLAPTLFSTMIGDEPVETFISPEVPQQVYALPLSPGAPSSITLQGSPGFEMSAQLRDENGQVVASVSGALPGVSFSLPAGEGTYELIVGSADSTQTGSVSISRSGLAGAPAPLATEAVSVPGAPPPADICAVFASAAGGVNLRTGPGTEFPQVASLVGDNYMTATGQYSGWYYGTYRGQNVWAAASVTFTQGASCANLPFVDPPSAPQTQPQPTAPSAEPTVAPTQPTGDTAQPTQDVGQPTMEPTVAPPTEAPTEAPTQAAFPDSPTQLTQWNLQRDTPGNSPQTYEATISSPGWQSVRVRVDGLSNQGGANARRTFTFIVTCSSNDLLWSANRNQQNRNCNSGSSQSSFTFDSNQHMLYIRLESGPPVTYTIIATPN